jgi:alpha-ketoglutarate-dependent taurine dioxygenase
MHVDSLLSTADHHPVVITPRANASAQALREYLVDSRASVQRLLLQHGGILFRGFDLDGSNDLKACAESAGAQPFDYIGGDSPRSRVGADVYTSTDYPPSEVISMHNEMSYLPKWPLRLFFFCAVPARSGGQTPLAHSADVLRALPSDIVAKFREKKINYIRNFHPSIRLGKSWQATYLTHNRAEVEGIIAKQGSACHWSPSGALRVCTQCSAFTKHPQTGEEVWFNQAEQYHPSALDPALRTMFEQMIGKGQLPHDCEYGDGHPMDESVLAQIRRVLNDCKLLFDWQRSDLLMVDNVLMMHGRESFKGNRKILAYLSST